MGPHPKRRFRLDDVKISPYSFANCVGNSQFFGLFSVFGLRSRGMFDIGFVLNGTHGLRPKRICDHNRLDAGEFVEGGAFLGSDPRSYCS